METVLVTGATGKLGNAVIEALLDRGFNIRAATRHTTRVKWTKKVQPVVFNYEDPGLFKAALDGIDSLFLIAPPLDAQAPAKLIPFVEKAGEMGVRYVLFVSAFKADMDERSPLRKIELHLLESGIDNTILCPNFFMENFSTGWLAPEIATGNIRLPAGDFRTSFISVEDIARAAAVCIAEKRSGRRYGLTGGRALSYGEAVGIISDVSERPVSYSPISEREMMESARKQGMPESAILYMAQLFALVRKGIMAEITDSVREITGKEPVRFEEFAKQHAEVWKMRKAA